MELSIPTIPLEARSYFEDAVSACENGISQLREVAYRDVFKSKIEYAYLWLIEDYARRIQEGEPLTDRLVGLLEAVRHVETLAGFALSPDESKAGLQAQIDAARGNEGSVRVYLREKRAALLWVQATPNAVVFCLQTPERIEVAVAEKGLREELEKLSVAMQDAIDTWSESAKAAGPMGGSEFPVADVERWAQMLATNLREAELAATQAALTQAKISKERQEALRESGRLAFSALPEMVQALFQSDVSRVFLAPCSQTVNLLWELLHPGTTDDDYGYLGLTKELPRVHSQRQLLEVGDRQPTGEKNVVLVGDPNDNLRYSKEAARTLAGFYRAKGFDVGPSPAGLTGAKAEMQAVSSALSRDFRLQVFLGHGMPGGLQLRDGIVSFVEIAQYDWQHHPALHLACCLAGQTGGSGGGRFAGHPTAALIAGASCVLSSTMVLFDRQDAVFCEMLHRRLLDRPEQTMAEVLMETRREAARRYGGHPAVWAQYALWGNPDTRLLAA